MDSKSLFMIATKLIKQVDTSHEVVVVVDCAGYSHIGTGRIPPYGLNVSTIGLSHTRSSTRTLV